VALTPLAEGYGENWLTGWDYRYPLTVDQTVGCGTDYQVQIYVDYGSGSQSQTYIHQLKAWIFYVDGNCQTDFDDIFYTTEDGVTPEDFWLEEYVDSSYAIFWVEVSGDLDAGDVIIFMYYGNSGASSASSGKDTFVVFDDFEDASIDTSLWDYNTQDSGTTISESAGELHIVHSTGYAHTGGSMIAKTDLNGGSYSAMSYYNTGPTGYTNAWLNGFGFCYDIAYTTSYYSSAGSDSQFAGVGIRSDQTYHYVHSVGDTFGGGSPYGWGTNYWRASHCQNGSEWRAYMDNQDSPYNTLNMYFGSSPADWQVNYGCLTSGTYNTASGSHYEWYAVRKWNADGDPDFTETGEPSSYLTVSWSEGCMGAFVNTTHCSVNNTELAVAGTYSVYAIVKNGSYVFVNMTFTFINSTVSSYTENGATEILNQNCSVFIYFDEAGAGGGSFIVAAFTWTPANPAADQQVLFNGTESESSSSITEYSWDFGDGNTTAGAYSTIYHSYASNDTYAVELTVTSDAGSDDISEFVIVGGGSGAAEGVPEVDVVMLVIVGCLVTGFMVGIAGFIFLRRRS
jgi:PKD repeat protein